MVALSSYPSSHQVSAILATDQYKQQRPVA